MIETKPVAAPLSFAQQRLWFLHQLAPTNPFYNMPTALRLQGHLEVVALQRSFHAIVQRHTALRTHFTEAAGQPVQIIAPQVDLAIPIMDLQSMAIEQQQSMAQQLMAEAAQRPFNLSTDPLLRVQLLQLDATEFILLLTMHHIVSDGWSLGVLIRELSTLYTAFVEQKPAALPDLPMQYIEFARWQRQWLQGEVLETQLRYWRKQLADVPMLNLPIDRPRPPVQTYRGATYPIQLSHQLTQALETLSQQTGVSLFMTLLAAFQVLLYRYTGQADIAVGAPIANRHYPNVEQLIGFFVNSLVLRTDLSGNPTVQELLDRVREVALAAYAHQDLPFERLVEELEPDRDLSRNPLFQVVFALQNAPVQPFELPGLTLKPVTLPAETTRFDIEFHLWDQSQGLNDLWQVPTGGLSGFVAYSTDLFDRSTIARMVEHFQLLLNGIAAHPDWPIAALPMLTLTEQQQLQDWNQTQAEYDQFACVHDWFEVHAEQTPAAVAIVFEDQQLTYGELNDRADQLAGYLQQQGVRPDTLVGVCVDRSLELLIGILAVLKAGGAYVPIDPSYPRDRIHFLLSDTQVPILLTQSWLVETLPPSPAQIVCLDTSQSEWHHSQTMVAQPSQPIVTSRHLAYVMYTSGSTGQPKGVMIEHRGLSNICMVQQRQLNLQPNSRILQFSSLSFDASVFEMLMAFGSGGTLYVVPQAVRLSETALAQFLRHHAITHAILPPAVLSVLPTDRLPALQTLISGGEACSQEIVDRWAGERQVFNAYGPTEVTICATLARLTKHSGKPSIGRPIANTQIDLLDGNQQQVPIGVAGEVYISGDGVARGYWNRPDLTAERFVAQPREQNTRCYKTGDLARYRSDGSLEFLGRLDDQVKIRGFRIELGEIETTLNQHPAIHQAVIVAHSVPSSDPQLVAYFTPELAAQKQAIQTLQDQQIRQWQTLYDQTYDQAYDQACNPTYEQTYEQTYEHSHYPIHSDRADVRSHQFRKSDLTLNTIGWNSSYTGKPIPREQMQEWVDNRVQQILKHQPDRVLEIGCGTGLLLFGIAPHCTHYCATDFSIASLRYLQPQLSPLNLSHVHLKHQSAHDFEGIETAAFDAVILNSVVQYFPSLDYLLQVLEGAIKAVAPGGFIFIGDIRSLPLLKAFHASVQIAQADAQLDRSHLQQRVQRAMFAEPELVIDPALFNCLRDRFPQINRVQIQLPRGDVHNEMTQFRYNVFLHIAPDGSTAQSTESPSQYSIQYHDWSTHPLSIVAVRQQLLDAPPDLWKITNIPNARVIAAVKTAEWLTDGTEADAPKTDAPKTDAPKTVGRMREALQPIAEQAIDPQDWWNLERDCPYTVEISWSDDSIGCYEVWLIRHGITFDPAILPSSSSSDRSIDRDQSHWHIYTNQPLQTQFIRQLIPQLRNHLEQILPTYMIPAAFVALEQMPLTANGKVDRRALPPPDEIMPALTPEYVAPRSPVEEKLVDVWTELLRIPVGIYDNFFELGGHSLLATQLVSRLRDAFGLEVPLQQVFEAPTIAQLAAVIEDLQTSRIRPQAPALVKLDRESHRRSRASLSRQQNRENINDDKNHEDKL